MRNKYFLGSLTYKIINGRISSYLADHFVLRSSLVRIDIRRLFRELAVPSWKREMFHNSFIVSAATFWNELLDVIKQSANLRTFKIKLYRYLLDH